MNITISDIPMINAVLNSVSTVLLATGFACIKLGKRGAHRVCMLGACGVSAVFLVGYVTHKILVRGVHTPFGGEGAIRGVYYTMLFSHILLAMAIAYLVPKTFFYAVRGDFEKHKRWAKWTFPIWYYVSITGVLVYLFLYEWWPVAAAGSPR